jgi:hypothetical protein
MMKLCNPALLYFGLAVISILLMIINKTAAAYVLGNIVGVLLWTWFLNFFCNKGFTIVSWMLVLSPYVIIFIALATGMINMSDLQEVQPPKKEDDNEPLVLV